MRLAAAWSMPSSEPPTSRTYTGTATVSPRLPLSEPTVSTSPAPNSGRAHSRIRARTSFRVMTDSSLRGRRAGTAAVVDQVEKVVGTDGAVPVDVRGRRRRAVAVEVRGQRVDVEIGHRAVRIDVAAQLAAPAERGDRHFVGGTGQQLRAGVAIEVGERDHQTVRRSDGLADRVKGRAGRAAEGEKAKRGVVHRRRQA